jgi:hypothetical protein
MNRPAGFSCAHAARRKSWYAANVTRGQRYGAAGCADITRLSRQRDTGKRYQQSRAAAAKTVTYHVTQGAPAGLGSAKRSFHRCLDTIVSQ